MPDLTDFLTDKFNTEVKRNKQALSSAADESGTAKLVIRAPEQPTVASVQQAKKQIESLESEANGPAFESPRRASLNRRDAKSSNLSATEVNSRREKPTAMGEQRRPEKRKPSDAKQAGAKPVSRKGRRSAPVVDRQNIRAMSMRTEWTSSQLHERGLVYAGMPDRDVLNAYRELRIKLMQASGDGNFVCMVSSLSRDASATTVAANLAASIALDKSKTALLIDCDLNGPGTEQFMVVHANRGVTDYLDDPELELRQIIYPSGLRRLRVIPLGNRVENSAEHFASQSMHRFIRSVKERYPDRFVIVIAPPIATSAEAKILTDLCDLAVLVMPYGKVVESQLQAAAAMVPANKFAGIVCPPEQ